MIQELQFPDNFAWVTSIFLDVKKIFYFPFFPTQTQQCLKMSWSHKKSFTYKTQENRFECVRNEIA